MPKKPSSIFSFTKLIVNDLEKMTRFYCGAYGMKELQRIQARIGVDPVDETILAGEEDDSAVLILMKYVDKPPPERGEVILGFRTDDLEALFDRIRAAGGEIDLDAQHDDASPYKGGFARDPEGHLAEIIQAVE